MKYFKQYSTYLLLTMIETITLLFLLTILFYYEVFSQNIYSLFKLILVFLPITYHSFLLGKIYPEKRYKTGLIFGLLWILILLVIGLFLSRIQTKSFFYYLLLLGVSILGSLLGSYKRKRKD